MPNKELLEEPKLGGKLMFIVTRKRTDHAKEVVRHFGIKNFFEDIFGGGASFDKKHIISDLLNKVPDVPKDKIVMVGNHAHDIEGANANNIHSIAVLYGYGKDEDVKNSNPTYLVDSLEALSDLLV